MNDTIFAKSYPIFDWLLLANEKPIEIKELLISANIGDKSQSHYGISMTLKEAIPPNVKTLRLQQGNLGMATALQLVSPGILSTTGWQVEMKLADPKDSRILREHLQSLASRLT